MSDYASLKVPELKKLLQEKSLPITGNKADLIARLQEFDKSQAKPEEQPKAAAGKFFLRSSSPIQFLSHRCESHTKIKVASKLILINLMQQHLQRTRLIGTMMTHRPPLRLSLHSLRKLPSLPP